MLLTDNKKAQLGAKQQQPHIKDHHVHVGKLNTWAAGHKTQKYRGVGRVAFPAPCSFAVEKDFKRLIRDGRAEISPAKRAPIHFLHVLPPGMNYCLMAPRQVLAQTL